MTRADASAARRPSGTVTLLFSDIEGSTRLWEREPKAMAGALTRHDELLRRAIEEAGGYVFKTVGDAFCAAFDSGKQAIVAALAAQRALVDEQWPDGALLRVRIALHTGECQERDGDYFGPTVNRAARLEAIAHGGQIIMSGTTAELTRDSLPDGTALVAIGTHGLKDLGRPETVFQFTAEGLDREFPPLRSLDDPALRHNLPRQISSFVSRDMELAEIRALIPQRRLTTLAGFGGSGKTRLALQAAGEVVEDFSDGVWFVELAPLGDPDLVVATVASTLGVEDQPGRSTKSSLLDFLRTRDVLLVLDNCEHLIESCAGLVRDLLRSCANLRILVTSRAPLNVDGERVFRVSGLSVPPEDWDDSPADSSPRFGAVELLHERAHDHGRPLGLDEETTATVAILCRRLDGIPLAIELAAAQLPALSVSDIAQRLEDRFRILVGRDRLAVPRHQTLRTLVDWSYDLLDDPERTLLRKLSVFAGGWDVDAAEAVCLHDQNQSLDVPAMLVALVEKSLVEVDIGESTTRYRLLETIREYAAEKLGEAAESEGRSASHAHASAYLALTESAASHLIGFGQPPWFDRLELELGNVRTALSYWLAHPQGTGEALRMGVALRQFWFCGYTTDGVLWLDRALALPGGVDVGRIRGEALEISGYLHFERGELASFESRLQELLSVSASLNEPDLASIALGGMSLLASNRGDMDLAHRLGDRSVEAALRGTDHIVLAEAFNHRGLALSRSGHSGAHEDLTQAREHYQAAGDIFGLARALQNLTLLKLKTGDLAGARQLAYEALGLLRQMRGRGMLMECHVYIGLIELAEGRTSDARQAFDEVLRNARESRGQPVAAAYGLLGSAFCSHASGADSSAATLHGASQQLFSMLGFALDDELRTFRDTDQRQLRRSMGSEDFDLAWQAGAKLGTFDAIELALADGDGPRPNVARG